METKKDLFSHDLVFSTIENSKSSNVEVKRNGGGYRLSNGRYASKSDALSDKYSHRIAWLEFERMKYMRAYLAVCDRLITVERKLLSLTNKNN